MTERNFQTLKCDFCNRTFIADMVAACFGWDGYSRCKNCHGTYEVVDSDELELDEG